MEFEVNKLLSPYIYNDILGLSKRIDFKPFTKKTVIITGAARPMGIYLSTAFLINNDLNNAETKIIAVDTDDKIFERYGKLTYRGDIDFVVSRDYSYFGGETADYIIHTQSFDELEKFDAAVNLMNFIKNSQATAVIAFDSGIYGEVFNGKAQISEADAFGYINFSKANSFEIQNSRMVQALAVKLARDCNADVKLAVLPEIYGAGMARWHELLTNVSGKRNVLVDQSEMPQSVIYLADAAAALVTILLKGTKGEAYNIASDYALNSAILAEKCSEYIYGGELKIIFTGKQASLSPLAPTLRILDNTKLKSLGFTPEFDLKSGITRTLNIMSEKGGEA